MPLIEQRHCQEQEFWDLAMLAAIFSGKEVDEASRLAKEAVAYRNYRLKEKSNEQAR